MSFLQVNFWMFLSSILFIYYIIPKKFQWMIILIANYIFYCFAGIKTVGFIVFTTITVWAGAIYINKINDNVKLELLKLKEIEKPIKNKKQIKQAAKKNQKKILVLVIIVNFGILAFLKYFNFLLENINSLVKMMLKIETESIDLGLVLPLGISFYTFQSIGYLIDVYNGKYKAERSLLKFAAFVSYFPQILQGPINRFNKLGIQLFNKKDFELKKIQYGLQLIMWGLFKKMVIADRAIIVVDKVFDNYKNYGGAIIIIGILFYSLQQYCDFSGGIDVAMGISELFGIKMSTNFKRPYFSISLSEFWRRWHITLGTWMRDYVFYPLALTKKMSKISKFVGKYFGKKIGKIIPVALSNIVVFLLVGIWHGPYWHYVAWGLYNGIIIAVSAFLEPVYDWIKRILKIKTECLSYHLFRILRTFFIVNLGWYFDRGNGVKAALKMLHITFNNFKLNQLFNGSLLKLGLKSFDFKILFLSTSVLLLVSIMQENNVRIRDFLNEQNIILRWLILYLLIFVIIGFGYESGNLSGGFIYAQF